MERYTYFEHGKYRLMFEGVEYSNKFVDRLAHYEDLEKQGRLVELPCRVGADVWYVLEMFGEICPAVISKIELNSFTIPQTWFTVVYYSRCIGQQEIKARSDFMLGKTVFLTREEAEATLGRTVKMEEQNEKP